MQKTLKEYLEQYNEIAKNNKFLISKVPVEFWVLMKWTDDNNLQGPWESAFIDKLQNTYDKELVKTILIGLKMFMNEIEIRKQFMN